MLGYINPRRFLVSIPFLFLSLSLLLKAKRKMMEEMLNWILPKSVIVRVCSKTQLAIRAAGLNPFLLATQRKDSHVYRSGWLSLSSKRIQLPYDTEWASAWKDVVTDYTLSASWRLSKSRTAMITIGYLKKKNKKKRQTDHDILENKRGKRNMAMKRSETGSWEVKFSKNSTCTHNEFIP